MPLHKNQIISLVIENISSDGNGVGRFDGMAVFVPATAAGDVLQVKIVKPSKSYAYGRIEQIVTPGEGRQIPDCPISGVCGGCSFRHLTYTAELAAKQAFVDDAVRRLGKLDFPASPILPSPEADRYRNKVQYPLAADPDGALAYGFYADRSHRVIPCQDCLLQPLATNRLAAHIVAVLAQMGADAYDETTHRGLVRHITLRRGAHSGEVLVCLVLNGTALPNNNAFVAALTAAHPEIKTIVLNQNWDATNVIHGKTSTAIYGPGVISDTLCGVPMQLNEHTFAQVNTPAAQQLFSVARSFAAPGRDTTLLDLYCGTGVIGLSMARQCKALLGVELVAEAVESARQSAAQMGLANTRFICADAGEAARALAEEGSKPDVIVLDPPRKGASPEALAAIVRLAPARVVMVSCNPATMARDLAELAGAGYHLSRLQPVDLFPRTKHVECVALMELR